MEEFLPLFYKKEDSFLLRKAKDELNENEASLAFEIKELRSLALQNEIPCSLEDDFLIWFLRSRKHDMNRALENLKKYSYARHNFMNYYGFIYFKDIRVPIQQGIIGLLPKRDFEGRAILFMRASQWDPSICDADTILRSLQALSHYGLSFPATQISGFCFICDCALASLHTLELFIKYARIVLPTLNVFPGRFQRMNFVNANAVLRGLSHILFALMPSKLKTRTQFSGNARETLPRIYHPSILPEEFGGTLGPINSMCKEWFKDFEDFVPKLHATNKYYKRKDTISFPETYNF